MNGSVSKSTLQRLPLYCTYLKSVRNIPPETISATAIAAAMRLNDVQVRKDLASVSTSGRPKIGYVKRELLAELESYLGYDDVTNAVLVGAGRLGSALYEYEGFEDYGLHIVAAFDLPEAARKSRLSKPVLPLDKLSGLCERLSVHIGIITVPTLMAQEICDLLVQSGVRGVWNFAPTHLLTPEDVIVQNVNMASSLAVLSGRLKENFGA